MTAKASAAITCWSIVISSVTRDLRPGPMLPIEPESMHATAICHCVRIEVAYFDCVVRQHVGCSQDGSSLADENAITSASRIDCRPRCRSARRIGRPGINHSKVASRGECWVGSSPARAAIHFLSGGLGQYDSFDLKPDAPTESG